MDKKRILQGLTFGQRIAEEESGQLSAYFVETDQWRRIFAGEVDVIYGPKGAGKSAIYALLMGKQTDLFDSGIVVIGAEKPRGTPAFNELLIDPPTSEVEFVNLWKLYILSLIGESMRDYGIANAEAKQVIKLLEDAGLLSKDSSLAGRLRSALTYARNLLHAEAVEGGLKLDPHSGLPTGITGKVTFREPSSELKSRGFISADAVLAIADEALAKTPLKAWVLFDRLDVAFAEKPELEQNALRALFKVYLDFADLHHLSLKIFLRSDIWRRITASGFREASHITSAIRRLNHWSTSKHLRH